MGRVNGAAFGRVKLRAHGGPGEQVNLDPWVDRLNVLERREHICWRIVDAEAGEIIVGG